MITSDHCNARATKRGSIGQTIFKAAIFDLDGVLVDTAKYHFQAWRRLANELGFDFTAEQNEHLKGVGRLETLEIVLA